MDVIYTSKLTKSYGQARGIIDLDLAVQEGEVFGFIGPNGAGKSTTIRTLLALICKTSGEAQIFGLDCERDYKTILADVGYLPGELHYYDNMRAIDLLQYAASFYARDCTKRIKELSRLLDLDLHKKIEDMSLGNKKKLGIVQGLLHTPKLIVLDEPTSGLDPLMQLAFFDLIQAEQRRGATVFFSSHILSEVQRICDRVAIIKEGRIVQTQDIAELLQQSYKQVTLKLRPAGNVEVFKELTGVTQFDQQGQDLNFIFNGDLDLLVHTLAGQPIANLEIGDPSLEEIFMHYYL